MEREVHKKWYAKPNFTENLFVSFGILVTLMWLLLFVAGIHINSSYYRTAIMYGYADGSDWLLATLTFTISNVAILAFLSGLLGGIISKVRITEGFEKTHEELKNQNISPILYENPFISAFRGVFIFIAVLSIQYFSSFSDLNSIANQTSQTPVQISMGTIPNQQVYIDLLSEVDDSASKAVIKKVWENQKASEKEEDMNAVVAKIRLYKDSITTLNGNREVDSATKKRYLESEIKLLRNIVKPPPGSDIGGLSASSYFKFAIVVSLLSFICGYDPARFAQFLSNFPFLKGSKEVGQQ